MTKSTITDERITSVIERLEHYACNLKWTNVRGAQDLLTAADGLRELQERRKADSEPVAWMNKGGTVLNVMRQSAHDFAHYNIPLYRHAQPALEYPEVLPCSVLLEPGLRFGKGIKTSTVLAALARRAVYESDMAELSPEERAEFQAGIEDFKALIAQPAPVVPEKCPAEICDLLASHTDALFNDDDAQEIWNACRSAMLQELKKSAGAGAVCRSSDNAQVLTSINPAPTLVSLPKNAKSLTGNSPVIGIDLASGPDRTVEVHYVVPPGYVVVPKEPTDEMIAAAMNCEALLFNSDDSFCVQFVNIYEAMLAAAPKEVK
ncbi:hypothetical protein [Klebsiella variicola]|uniref:hypothetical protein n=1 Tax=Klebsiella variicola TaxID=244366 RepID=UPI001F53E689|nr:hypothetical protein [Klebsiella variicola]